MPGRPKIRYRNVCGHWFREKGGTLKSMRFVVAVTLILGAFCATAGQADELLFSGDSAGGEAAAEIPAGWQVQSGSWKVVEDALQGTNCRSRGLNYTARGLATDGGEWTDFRLTMEFRVKARGDDWRDGPWIGFRYRGHHNAYTLGFYESGAYLHKVSEGRSTGDSNPLAMARAQVDNGQWHTVAITVVGNTIGVRLDGDLLLAAEDRNWNDSPRVRRGGVVLSARSCGRGRTRVEFRSVRLTRLEDLDAEVRRAARNNTRTLNRMREFLERRQSLSLHDAGRRVLAFYYPWYGNPDWRGRWSHWEGVDRDASDIANAPHYPDVGPYDSLNPGVLERHVQQARSHGVDGFICSWWVPGDHRDRAFEKLLQTAEGRDFKVTLYWETVPGPGGHVVDRAASDLAYVLQKYGDSSAFLKVQGKPVIFAFGRVMNQVMWYEWPEVIRQARRRAGMDFLLIPGIYRDHYARAFAGVHTYLIASWTSGKSLEEVRSVSRRRYGRAVRMAERYGKISCLTVIPGFDNSEIQDPSTVVDRRGGELYRALWRSAIEAGPDWVLITSWNEWHEGSEIEPSIEHGDNFLRLTGEYSERFKRSERN